MSQIVLFKDTGECGNRLVTYCFLLSISRESSIPITNLYFWRYARYFDYPYYWIEYPWLEGYQKPNKCLVKLEYVLGDLLEDMLQIPEFDKIQKQFLFQGDILCKPKELIFRYLSATVSRLALSPSKKLKKIAYYSVHEEVKWDHYSAFLISSQVNQLTIFEQNLVEKHVKYLRQRFQPIEKLRLAVDAFVSPLRKQFTILVGVHIRRVDYKTYRNGKYYFSNELFFRWMMQIKSQYKKDDVGFIICSNEHIELEIFAPLSVFRSPGHFIVDMYTLANCDLIIGPQSTFSGWASFIGNTPIYFLTNEIVEKKVDITTFSIWEPRFF